MKHRPNYLNIVLSAIALLLAAQLWVSISERPLLSDSAEAATVGSSIIPNAAEQRKSIIDEIKKLQREVTKTNKFLKDQKIKVIVTNIDELTRGADTR